MGKYNFFKKETDKDNEKKKEPQDVTDFFRREVGETREFVRRINEKNSNDVRIIMDQAA